MNEIPYKKLTPIEISDTMNKMLTVAQSANDWVIDPVLCMGGPLYQRLWFLSCAASLLAKEYIERQCQQDAKIFLEALSTSGAKYAGKTMLEFACLIGEIENLTKEEEMNFIQAIFEKIILAINETLFPEKYLCQR